jgi:hypothetical protein
MSQIKLELTVEETQGVLNSLGAQPFNQVAGLIEKIKKQALPQVQELEAQMARERAAQPTDVEVVEAA